MAVYFGLEQMSQKFLVMMLFLYLLKGWKRKRVCLSQVQMYQNFLALMFLYWLLGWDRITVCLSPVQMHRKVFVLMFLYLLQCDFAQLDQWLLVLLYSMMNA